MIGERPFSARQYLEFRLTELRRELGRAQGGKRQAEELLKEADSSIEMLSKEISSAENAIQRLNQ